MTLWFAQHYGFHDTCGVNNLHGMPALIAGVGSAVVAALATKETYGSSLYKVFPHMAPVHNETLCRDFLSGTNLYFGSGLTAHQQGGYQMAAQVVTLIFAIVGGIITGFILK